MQGSPNEVRMRRQRKGCWDTRDEELVANVIKSTTVL